MSKIFNNFDGSDSSMTPDRVEYVNWGEEGKDWHLQTYSRKDPKTVWTDQLWKAYRKENYYIYTYEADKALSFANSFTAKWWFHAIDGQPDKCQWIIDYQIHPKPGKCNHWMAKKFMDGMMTDITFKCTFHMEKMANEYIA